MKKAIIYSLIGLVLILTVSCASTTRVDQLEFQLSEKEAVLNNNLDAKAAKIEDLLASLNAATDRIADLENSVIPSVENKFDAIVAAGEDRIETLEAAVPVGEKRIKALESVVPVGEKRIETLEAYLPLYYGVMSFIEDILPKQQKALDALSEVVATNQALLDAFEDAGFSVEY